MSKKNYHAKRQVIKIAKKSKPLLCFFDDKNKKYVQTYNYHIGYIGKIVVEDYEDTSLTLPHEYVYIYIHNRFISIPEFIKSLKEINLDILDYDNERTNKSFVSRFENIY